MPYPTPPNSARPPGGTGGKIGRYILVGLGGSLVVSAAVNMVAAFQLLETSDEQSLGITRNQIVGSYAVLALAGIALIWAGLRRKK